MTTMIDAEQWTCPTCGETVFTRYCPACGEGHLLARELTLRGLFDQLVQALTSIDGRLIRTFRCLLSHPGRLTMAYLHGRRKPYVGPVSLFLIANVLFFAMESLCGGTIFTTPLDSHLHNQPWSPFVESLVTNRLATTQTTIDLYAPDFNRAIARNARSLIIFMVLSFALLPPIVFPRSKWPFVAHAVFALHLYAFLLMLFCLATAIPPFDVFFGGAGFASESLDHAIAVGLLIACAIYLYIAIGAVYGGSAGIRGLKAAALTVFVASIVLGYRFFLLLVTLYST
jgi:hypothetical protein